MWRKAEHHQRRTAAHWFSRWIAQPLSWWVHAVRELWTNPRGYRPGSAPVGAAMACEVNLPDPAGPGGHAVEPDAAMERTALIRDLEQRRRDAEDLVRMASRFSQSLCLDDVAPLIVQELRQAFDADRTELWVLNEPGTESRCVAAAGRDADALPGLTVDITQVQPLNRRLAAGQSVTLADMAAYPQLQDLRQRLQSQSLRVLPLVAGDALIGVLIVDFVEPGRQLPDERLTFAQAIAGQAAYAVANARLFNRLAQRQQDAEALVRVAAALTQTFALQELAPMLLGEMRDRFGADRAELWLMATDRASACCFAAVGDRSDEVRGFTVERSDIRTMVELIDTGQPVLVPDVAASPLRDQPWVHRFDLKSLAFFMLKSEGLPIGYVILHYCTPGSTIPTERLPYALSLASQVASAISHGELFEKLERRRRDAESLAQITAAVSQSLRMEELVPTLLAELHRRFEPERAELWLLSEERSTYVCVGAVGVNGPAVVGTRVPRDAVPVADKSINTAGTLFVTDMSRSELAKLPHVKRYGPRGGLLIALGIGGERIGVLSLAYADLEAEFPIERLPYAEAIAAHVTTALANARMFESLEQRRRDAEALVRITAAVSHSLRLEDSVPALLHELHERFGADRASLWLVDEDRDAYTCVGAVGLGGTALSGQRVQRSVIPESLELLEAGRTLVLTDVRQSEFSVLAHVADANLRGAVMLPLSTGGTMFGILGLSYVAVESEFPMDRLPYAEAVAAHVATAIANARLFERLERTLSHLQQVQEQLIQSERMSALGQLASLVSHEIKNRFNVIMTAATLVEMIADRPGNGDRLRQTMATIKKEVERGNELMLRLLRFARPQEAHRELVPLSAVIDTALATARRANVQIVRNLPAGLPPIVGDPAALEQVFLNLVLNAIQAMPTGGTITVRAAATPPWLEVAVSDTGTGMTPEVRNHLFEPFYTTKEQGTGLGLVITKQVIEQHRGTISCESTPGEGTTFTIRLPIRMPDELAELERGTGLPPGDPEDQAG